MTSIRLAVVCDYPEEGWPSMDLVGEMLLTHLGQEHAEGIQATRVCPPFRHRLTRWPVTSRLGPARNADRLLNRFWDYPRALERRGMPDEPRSEERPRRRQPPAGESSRSPRTRGWTTARCRPRRERRPAPQRQRRGIRARRDANPRHPAVRFHPLNLECKQFQPVISKTAHVLEDRLDIAWIDTPRAAPCATSRWCRQCAVISGRPRRWRLHPGNPGVADLHIAFALRPGGHPHGAARAVRLGSRRSAAAAVKPAAVPRKSRRSIFLVIYSSTSGSPKMLSH